MYHIQFTYLLIAKNTMMKIHARRQMLVTTAAAATGAGKYRHRLLEVDRQYDSTSLIVIMKAAASKQVSSISEWSECLNCNRQVKG